MDKDIRKQKKKYSRKRLRELLAVLRKRRLYKGMTPEKLRLAVEDLGPTFIKLGQLASTRDDMIPEAYAEELAKLRTQAAEMSIVEVKEVLARECKSKMDDMFRSFTEKPLGSASIAQVHAAVLHDGRQVVVKIQRPGIYEIMEWDIVLLKRLARFVKRLGLTGDLLDLEEMLEEIWVAAKQEMDFLAEAKNLAEFARLNQSIASISCPQVIREYTSKCVLVMERINGIPINDIKSLKEQGYDKEDLGKKLIENYVKQVLIDGFFHADPHPGNIMVRKGQIVWLDMGMMGRLSERDKGLFQQAMKAVVEQDVLSLKEFLLTIGSHSGRVNHARLYADLDNYLARYGTMSLEEMTQLNMGDILTEMVEMAESHGISMPKGITMLGRGVIIMESLLLQLDPQVNFISVMANHLSDPVYQEMDPQQFLKDSSRALLISARRMIDIPHQLSDLLKLTMKGQTKLNYEIDGSEEWNTLLKFAVNKLVLCLLAGALIIGASMLYGAGSGPFLWGMPVLSLIGYLTAAVLILRLLWWIHKKY